MSATGWFSGPNMLWTTSDPEHRLVAAQLERDWSQALAKVAEIEKEGERENCGEFTIAQASTALDISLSKTYHLIKLGILPAQQACFGAPWIIQE